MPIHREAERRDLGRREPDPADQPRDKSIGELFNELASQSASLVRDEVALAKQEVSEKVASYKGATILLGLGAVLGLIATLSLCTALIIAVGERIGMWQSALLIGTVLAVVAGATAFYGLHILKNITIKPEQTIETLEEDKEWLKEMV